MPRFAFHMSILLALAGTLGAQFVFGRLSSGTRERQQLLSAAADRIEALPRQFGPWKGGEDSPLAGGAVDMLQCAGYANRTYVHSETGEIVTLTVLTGPAGPLVAHTPQICFSSREYEVQIPPAPEDFPPSNSAIPHDIFFGMTFRARTLAGERLNVHFAWARSAGGWQAPDHPRVTLAGEPILFKLQVLARAGIDDEQAPSSCHRFLTDALPEINRCLFGGPIASTTNAPAPPITTDPLAAGTNILPAASTANSTDPPTNPPTSHPTQEAVAP